MLKDVYFKCCGTYNQDLFQGWKERHFLRKLNFNWRLPSDKPTRIDKRYT